MSEARPLRHLASVCVSNVDKKTAEGQVPVRLCNYTDVYYGDRISPDLDLMTASATPEQLRAFRLQAGDVIITKDSEDPWDIAVPAFVSESASDLVCGYHLAVLRPKVDQLDGRYLYWAMSSGAVRDFLSLRATGITRFGLRTDSIASTPLPWWPMERQRAIADFLDAETARIDALIAKKRKLITTVTERFEAAVYSAVTGKDQSGPQKDSGVDWIGEVPTHWGVPWLGAHYSTQLGKMLNAEAAGGPDQYPYLRNVNVQWDRVDLTDVAAMHFSVDDRRRCILRPGDLLVCEGGEVGRAAVWSDPDREMYFQKAIHRVRPLTDGNVRYLMYCLWAAARMDVFTVEGNQSTIVHLTGEKLREHRFPYPPVDEQDRIASTIDRHRAQAQSLAFNLEKQIDLLSEHRQALITAAVTGELDIPGVAA